MDNSYIKWSKDISLYLAKESVHLKYSNPSPKKSNLGVRVISILYSALLLISCDFPRNTPSNNDPVFALSISSKLYNSKNININSCCGYNILLINTYWRNTTGSAILIPNSGSIPIHSIILERQSRPDSLIESTGCDWFKEKQMKTIMPDSICELNISLCGLGAESDVLLNHKDLLLGVGSVYIHSQSPIEFKDEGLNLESDTTNMGTCCLYMYGFYFSFSPEDGLKQLTKSEHKMRTSNFWRQFEH